MFGCSARLGLKVLCFYMVLDPKGTSSSGSSLLLLDADVVQQWGPLHSQQIKSSNWFDIDFSAWGSPKAEALA